MFFSAVRLGIGGGVYGIDSLFEQPVDELKF